MVSRSEIGITKGRANGFIVGGGYHVGASFGWLGDYRRIDYRHRMRACRDWVLGFGVGYLLPSGVVFVVPVPIINYSAVVEGQLFKA